MPYKVTVAYLKIEILILEQKELDHKVLLHTAQISKFKVRLWKKKLFRGSYHPCHYSHFGHGIGPLSLFLPGLNRYKTGTMGSIWPP